MTPLVAVAGVTKRFGAVTALDKVSLDVPEGQAVALIGPSGSGKSTLLRCINGLEAVSEGRITVGGALVGLKATGQGVKRLPERAVARQRRQIGMVFQSFNLFYHMTALDNVAAGPVHALGHDRAQAHALARELLGRVGLSDKEASYPRQLSGGQQQRVAIARALAMKPSVMLFDEPTSALDPESVQEVLTVIREVCQSRVTVLIATHEMEFARFVSDWTVFMEHGRIVEQGPSAALFAGPQTERCQRFLAGLVGVTAG